MAKVTAGLPQGTRDFSAEVVRKRNYILNTIKNVFELYGFEPLETPAMENLETLTGKYGEEGDKLIFRILDSGNPFSKDFFRSLNEALIIFEQFADIFGEDVTDSLSVEEKQKMLEENKKNKLGYTPEYLEQVAASISSNPKIFNTVIPKMKSGLSEKALKYDLTIPFARYVAMNHNKLTFPFKRYQVQPVWRADRPQKGRYREFYQCDADVVGSNSLMSDVEFAIIYASVFEKLKIPVEIKINSRKILAGVAETINAPERLTDITVAIDKIDKIGMDGVIKELEKKGFTNDQISQLEEFILFEADKIMYMPGALKENYDATKLDFLKSGSNYRKSEILQEGVKEVEYILDSCNSLQISNITVDFSLARGLNYYTGIIFEVSAKNVQMGSIGGGGRYDDLTGLFGVPNIPGVGISFGVDRIYDVMEELQLFPDDLQVSTKVLFFNLGEEESKASFNLLQQLRGKGVSGELYHEPVKFDKQFKYAEKKNIPYVIIIGSKELAEKNCSIKNIITGVQQTVSFDNMLNYSFL
jgi:histidyl-tRNA synthetase